MVTTSGTPPPPSPILTSLGHLRGFWDFTANQAHGDTAYTGLPLPAHTDTTYFTDPVGLQLFHLIEFTGTGGKSLYVDGFHVAAQLQQSHPWAYEALTRIPIPCHSAGDAHTIIAPTHAPSRFSTSPTQRSTRSEWTRLLRGARNEVWMQLEPGMAVVLDNWRVLHGRSGFEGHRRMVGSYHNWDDYRSRVRDLCYGRLGRADL
ncbi:hypothetical protein BC829DRAFT_426493 [Chytridium lagenaria]|nr:hypothetical protein BC829DRAFT_426493 [Chytridium lagenaria]